MKYTYSLGKTSDGRFVTVTIDIDHPEIARMIVKAMKSKGGQSVEAGGALVVKLDQ